ncbi:hypothetical protein M413DRAFT_340581 [Hebeloma cylindrosporum]|uniref:Uncharacterized protein n=1 Tax=Hebeloma cylindrosporum TaxID=76867 RepID=A0A0C2YWQ1_HEBCY|nr:hypothetical protein M413DRAFT_340581 [Hebeloma cylindrosporum h7]
MLFQINRNREMKKEALDQRIREEEERTSSDEWYAKWTLNLERSLTEEHKISNRRRRENRKASHPDPCNPTSSLEGRLMKETLDWETEGWGWDQETGGLWSYYCLVLFVVIFLEQSLRLVEPFRIA